MARIYWAPLLHFYQPPTQIPGVLRRICDESYRPLVRLFTEHPHAKVTVNINGSLTEQLDDLGAHDVIRGLRELAERGQLEFVGSGKYHPILPLIPEDEARRQILLNRETNRRYFGDAFQPRGFFPPEMCYGQNVAAPILETGHEWVIVSGVACPTRWPMDEVHCIASEVGELAVFFRDDLLSNRISFQAIDAAGFLGHLRSLNGHDRDLYVVTAMDAETFGHHIRGWERQFLGRVYEELAPDDRQAQLLADQHKGLFAMVERGNLAVVTISDLLDRFPRGQVVEPKPSSWSTSGDDLAAGNPYPLWKDPGNWLHGLQWQLVDISIELTREALRVADNDLSRHHARIARALLDRALHSCQFWWASKRPMWDINMIHRGMLEHYEVLLNAFKAINCSGAGGELKRDCYYKVVVARDLANKIADHLFVH